MAPWPGPAPIPEISRSSRCPSTSRRWGSSTSGGGAGQSGSGPTPGDYERRDTLVSLGMGVGSLVVPLVAPRVLGPLTPGRGRYGAALLRLGSAAAAVTTLADAAARWADYPHRPWRRQWR